MTGHYARLDCTQYIKDENNNYDKVDLTMVDFENYQVECIVPGKPKLVSISKITVKYVNGEWIQFSLIIANEISIHRSQEQPYKSVYVDLGPSKFSLGLTFVALFRCTRSDTLVIKPFLFPRLTTLSEKKKERFDRLHELKRLKGRDTQRTRELEANK